MTKTRSKEVYPPKFTEAIAEVSVGGIKIRNEIKVGAGVLTRTMTDAAK